MKAAKKTTGSAKADPGVMRVPGEEGETTSSALARLATTSALSAFTMKQYAGCGDGLEVTDLVAAMKRAGDKAVAGDTTQIERMLVNQMLSLEVIFDNLAQRAGKQDTFKGIEVLMRLALKAQSQARATAETLATIKNPMPYIRQANIANGHQQVINGQPAGAGNFQNAQNELLEDQHGNHLDIGAPAATGSPHPHMATMGAVNRATDG